MKYRKIIYIKRFGFKKDAEKFIKSHKKQNCFELRPDWNFMHGFGWQVIKTKPIDL